MEYGRVALRRRREVLQREPAQEPRVERRAVGEPEPVRLHHVARLAVDALEHARDGEQVQVDEAPLLQLQRKALRGEGHHSRRGQVYPPRGG